ncbi:hypothetical protein BH10PSE17_BH10PSE17_08900 [soil metagenome]
MNDITIGSALEAHVEPAQELLLHLGLPIEGVVEHFATFLAATGPDDALVGCVGLEVYGSFALLRSLAVAPEWQGRGLGGRLLDAALQEAGELGLASVFLLTTSASDFFRRRRFDITQRSHVPTELTASEQFRGACPASATCMSLHLQGNRGSVVVRTAVHDDAAAILSIYAPMVRDTSVSFELEVPSLEEMRSRMGEASGRFPWLVSLDADDRVNGYCYASRHRERAAYRWSVDTTVYVREDSRGGGVGRALYQYLFESLTQLGYAQAFAGITLPNAASVALHQSMGFTQVGVYRSVGFKLGAWRDVSWWQRELRTSTASSDAPAPP